MSKISLAIISLFLILTAACSPLPVRATSSPLATDPNFACTDLKIVFARHSGAELNEKNYLAYVRAFHSAFADTDLTISSYELGSHPGGYAGYSYPSPGIGIQTWERFTTSLGAIISAGSAYAFGDSVKTGANEATYFISNYKRLCPNSRVILGGYSQGAQVVSLALQSLNPNDIFQAHTFGDPKLYLPEGTPSGVKTSSRACREGRTTYSHYRTFVPDCYTYEGVLGGYRPYDPYLSVVSHGTPAQEVPLATPQLSLGSPYLGKIKVYCQHHDVICSAYVDLAHFAYGHATYLQQGSYDKAAHEVYQALFPHSTNPYTRPIQNVALLIDNTDSMNENYHYYLSVITQVAKKYLERGDQVALYSYRDLATEDPNYRDTPHAWCDFSTCTLNNLPELLKEIYFTGGGDDPESTLSASYTLMKELNWTNGANKSVIVFTDNGFHSPDLDGTTLDDVVTLSEQIDPVNFYFFVPQWEVVTYYPWANRTNGAVYAAGTNEVFLSLNQEIADRLGDTDLFLPSRERTQAELTSLSAAPATWGDIAGTSLTSPEGITKVAFNFSPETVHLIVTINEDITGYIDLQTNYLHSFFLTDLQPGQETKVCIAPVSRDAYRSSPTCVTVKPDVVSSSSDTNSSSKEPSFPERPISSSAEPPSLTPKKDVIVNSPIPRAPNTGFANS